MSQNGYPRIKIMANMNIAEKRKPQDSRMEIKIAGKEIDIRVSVLPVIHGECVVMRLLDKSRTFVKLEMLGFPSFAWYLQVDKND